MIGQGGNACIPRGFIFFFCVISPPRSPVSDANGSRSKEASSLASLGGKGIPRRGGQKVSPQSGAAGYTRGCYTSPRWMDAQ